MPNSSRIRMYTFPVGNAACATRPVSAGTGCSGSRGKLILHPSRVALLPFPLLCRPVSQFANSIELTFVRPQEGGTRAQALRRSKHASAGEVRHAPYREEYAVSEYTGREAVPKHC